MNILENAGMETIPHFIKAKNPRVLRLRIRRNNLRLRGFVDYRIQWVESEQTWYAWYYANATDKTVAPEEQTTEEDS